MAQTTALHYRGIFLGPTLTLTLTLTNNGSFSGAGFLQKLRQLDFIVTFWSQ